MIERNRASTPLRTNSHIDCALSIINRLYDGRSIHRGNIQVYRMSGHMIWQDINHACRKLLSRFCSCVCLSAATYGETYRNGECSVIRLSHRLTPDQFDRPRVPLPKRCIRRQNRLPINSPLQLSSPLRPISPLPISSPSSPLQRIVDVDLPHVDKVEMHCVESETIE